MRKRQYHINLLLLELRLLCEHALFKPSIIRTCMHSTKTDYWNRTVACNVLIIFSVENSHNLEVHYAYVALMLLLRK